MTINPYVYMTHTPPGLMGKKAKLCTLITAAMHFYAFYLSSAIDFMASITFNGIELWKEPWSDTEASVRRNLKRLSSDILFLSFLSLFSYILFSSPWGKMQILPEVSLEFCLPKWLCFGAEAGYCPYTCMTFIVNMICESGMTLD